MGKNNVKLIAGLEDLKAPIKEETRQSAPLKKTSPKRYQIVISAQKSRKILLIVFKY